jgi:hypothetical protein
MTAKVCEICYTEMFKIHDTWNFVYYWFCPGCGSQIRCDEGE